MSSQAAERIQTYSRTEQQLYEQCFSAETLAETGLSPGDFGRLATAHEAVIQELEPLRPDDGKKTWLPFGNFLERFAIAQQRGSDIGIIRKNRIFDPDNPDKLESDGKYFSHVHPEAKEVWGGNLERAPKEFRDFINMAEEFMHLSIAAQRRIIEELSLNPEYATLLDDMYPMSGKRNFFLRVVTYDPYDPNVPLSDKYGNARGHYDISMATWQLWANDNGFAGGKTDIDEDMTTIDQVEGRAPFFLGLGWRERYPESTLIPLWHGVADFPNPEDRQVESRTAVILFSHLAYINTIPTKEEAHTPINHLPRE